MSTRLFRRLRWFASCLVLPLCLPAGSAFAERYAGTNAPGTGTNFTVSVGPGVTNLALTVPGAAGAYSYVLVRRGAPATDTDYDFISAVDRQTNAVYLEWPEVVSASYSVRVRTPVGSQPHIFSLEVETNLLDLRTAAKPVSKRLPGLGSGVLARGGWHYFRVVLATNTTWRVLVNGAGSTSPDLYVQRDALPSESVYLKRSVNFTNDALAFVASEGTPGTYNIGILAPLSGPGPVSYSMTVEPVTPVMLTWDPGVTHEGTTGITNLTGTGGDHYFRITTANPSLGAWRSALQVLEGEAHLYLRRGALPTPNEYDFKSDRAGSDGFVLSSTQFNPSEDWYYLVQADAGAKWTLVSGSPYVMDLGTVAADGSSGSGDVAIGPEGLRYFRTSVPVDLLAWRLWLTRNATNLANLIYLKKTGVPVPFGAGVEQSQAGQMLVVPPYLAGGQQYFVGVQGLPGTVINLDSRQHAVADLAYGASVSSSVTGFCYVTYRVQVPSEQIAWQLYLPSTGGNPNFAVRLNQVANENYNDAYSELAGAVPDNITLVPPTLSDGTFYVTVYGTNGYQFTLQNNPAVVTDINYISTVTNDDINRVGWRFYRVPSIDQQLGSLGWDLLLTNYAPGTQIAVRRNKAPGIWLFRNPGAGNNNFYDALSFADFLQLPDNQADVWYIGVYNPTNALGPFTLITRELPAEPLVDNVPVHRTNLLAGRWDFFRMDVPASSNVLGWDLRLTNVTSGSPQLVVRREAFPTSLGTTFNVSGTNWPNRTQWAASLDWTRRTFSADGTNETGRLMAMARGRPLEPAVYYVGVLNTPGNTNRMSYTLISRWIGPGQAIPVNDLPWQGGSATNTLGAREAAYYRVTITNGTPSWKVRLTPNPGEAMLVVTTNWLPGTDSEKRVQKPGKEHYLALPPVGGTMLTPGTYFLAVVSEGDNPPDAGRVGTNVTRSTVESLGALPIANLGTLTTNDLVYSGTLESGEVAALQFQDLPSTLGFWIFLDTLDGSPYMVSRGGPPMADPTLGGDLYGNEGGQPDRAISSSYMITVADPYLTETIMVKARSTSPDAHYTVRVKMIPTEPLVFDGGAIAVTNQTAGLSRFFSIDVPTNALGWDVRLTNVTQGSPQLVVMREALPIFLNTFLVDPVGGNTWPIGGRWYAPVDWTGRYYAPSGRDESGRILAMGMGRPLEPGRYYVGVLAGSAASYTILSRGIGPGYNIPVNPLAFSGGTAVVTNLPPREAAYFRVDIPTNTASWKVRLSATRGESLLVALKGTLPNVLAAPQYSVTLPSPGRRVQKLGDEEFLLLPPYGASNLLAGTYSLTAVSEGVAPLSAMHIGTESSDFLLTSLGEAPVRQLGVLGPVDIVETNSLAAGECQLYQFSVAPGALSVEVRLEDRVNNPVMVLRPGTLVPDPGIGGDTYGHEGGQATSWEMNPSLITLSNPTNGVYTLVVKARSNQAGMPTNASYVLRLNAGGAVTLDGDGGFATVTNQSGGGWRHFRVDVPANAVGWDVRLTSVLSGQPLMVIRRGSVPTTLSSSVGLGTTPWPDGAQYLTGPDWTRRSFTPDGLTNEDGRVFAAGVSRPLPPGVYYIGVNMFNPGTNVLKYTITSRLIGSGFMIPVQDLPFNGSLTNLSLPAREAAYYRVVVPSNSPNWKLKLAGLVGECMLTVMRDSVPNIDTISAASPVSSGRAMQKLGNEHFVCLPNPGMTNIPPGTNYLAVIGEGINPGPASSGRIGSGSSSYVASSFDTLVCTNLGLVTSEDLQQADQLEGGEVKVYRFTVPIGTYGVRVRLDNPVGNPGMVLRQGQPWPDPGAGLSGLPWDPYGNEGGYVPTHGHPTLITVPNASPGVYTLMVKARQLWPNYPDASFTLRVQELLAPELNFDAGLNTNGLDNTASGLLADNERTFFKFSIPATYQGQPVIGWQLDVSSSNGVASVRAQRDSLPNDLLPGMPFNTGTTIIAPPFLTNGLWFVEVKGSGSPSFRLTSSLLTLQRPAWEMPAPGEPSRTPGVTLPEFGSTDVAPDGSSNGVVQLAAGRYHYYAVQVPPANTGLLRVMLVHQKGNPDLFMRAGNVPTLSHGATPSGQGNQAYDRAMTALITEYANWVPLDGRLERNLAAGLYYLAVKAGDTADAHYRLILSVGNIMPLPLHGGSVTNQEVAGGDWLYYRLQLPTAVPISFNVTFGQDKGDVVMHLRDTVPPGTGRDRYEIRDWSQDYKNLGPYPSFDLPGTYTFETPLLRPGQVYYLGFRATADSTFNLRVTTNGVPGVEPQLIDFYGGMAATNLPPHSQALYRIDAPPEALRWLHFSTHTTNLVLFLRQGTLPQSTNTADWYSTVANSTLNRDLAFWNAPLKQYLPGTWPWFPGQSYFLVVTNPTAGPQDFVFLMDGRNALTDNIDNDGLPDAWEYLYFNYIGQVDNGDPDQDGVLNIEEYQDGTNPADPQSYNARLVIFAINGSVARSPDLARYPRGSQVVLTPMPDAGYAFVGWAGQASGTASPLVLTMDSHKTNVIARFKLAGDDFATAGILSGSWLTVTGSNVGMTKEPGEPNHAGNPGGKSIWWRWTAPTSGFVTLTTAGSTFNTLLAVYTGSTVSNLTPIASQASTTTNRSTVNFNAVAGVTYQIAVDGVNGASSRITLTLSMGGGPGAPCRLDSLVRGGNGVAQFMVSGQTNRAYAIEASTNLTSWATITNVTIPASGRIQIVDPGAVGHRMRFYRGVSN